MGNIENEGGIKMIHHIENGQLVSEVIQNEKLVIVDFFATWCGPCQMLTPILADIDKEYEDVEIYKIDVDENQDATMRYGVTAMPTLVFFKNGKEVERQVGLLPKEALQNLINELR